MEQLGGGQGIREGNVEPKKNSVKNRKKKIKRPREREEIQKKKRWKKRRRKMGPETLVLGKKRESKPPRRGGERVKDGIKEGDGSETAPRKWRKKSRDLGRHMTKNVVRMSILTDSKKKWGLTGTGFAWEPENNRMYPGCGKEPWD